MKPLLPICTLNGQPQVFFIYFIQDYDGVWRVDAM